MGKFIKMFFLIFACFLMLINKVSAATTELTCVYNMTKEDIESSSSDKIDYNHVNCYFNSNKKFDTCRMFSSTSNSTNKEDIDNTISSWYKNNERCPKYLLYVQTGALNLFGAGHELYLYDSLTDIQKQYTNRKKYYSKTFIYELTSYKNIDGVIQNVQKKEEMEIIEGYIKYFENFGKNSELDKYCDLKDGVYLISDYGYNQELCRKTKASVFNLISTWNANVDKMVSDGKVSAGNNNVKKYKKYSDDCLMMLGRTGDSPFSPVDDPSNTIKPNYTDEEKDYIEENDYKEEVPREIVCPLGPEVTKDLSGALKIFKILAPLIMIVVSTFEIIKTITKGDTASELKNVAKRFGKRAIYAILMFFLPVIINQIMIIANVWNENGQCDLSNPVENVITDNITSKN